MKYMFFKKILFLLLFSSISLNTFAYQNIHIDKYDVDIKVNEDSSVEIIEKILVDFDINERRGIIRFVPYAYGQGDNYIELDLDILKVTDQNNIIYDYEINSDYFDYYIKIGNPDVYITGKHWYYIYYNIDNLITPLDNHDELYWNVTGTGWEFPIENVTVNVELPENSNLRLDSLDCYTGYFAALDKDCEFEVINDYTASFGTNNTLNSYQGLTIAVALDKGVVDTPAVLELVTLLADDYNSGVTVNIDDKVYEFVRERDFRLRPGEYEIKIEKFKYLTHFQSISLESGERLPLYIELQPSYIKKLLDFYLPIGLFLFFSACIYFYWWRYGKDPKGRGMIIPIYEVPDNLRPAEIGLLIDEKAHLHDVTATIIDLAIRGYFKIKKKEIKKKFFGQKASYTFIKLKSSSDLRGYEKKVYEGIFKKDVKSVSMSKLKSRFYRDLRLIKKNLYERVVELSFFTTSPEKVRNKNCSVGCIVSFFFLFFPIMIGGVIDSPYFLLLLLVPVELLVMTIYLPKKTLKGVLCYEKVLGYKMFLDATEKDRLKLLYGPDEYKGVFEKHLPYAIAMGIEKSWVKQFKGIYEMDLDWYDSPETLTNRMFLEELMAFNIVAERTIVSRPGSSGSSGSGWGGSSWSGGSSSGSSGGGFSGGGFGGGGGSSW